jgi:hypothetical protein
MLYPKLEASLGDKGGLCSCFMLPLENTSRPPNASALSPNSPVHTRYRCQVGGSCQTSLIQWSMNSQITIYDTVKTPQPTKLTNLSCMGKSGAATAPHCAYTPWHITKLQQFAASTHGLETSQMLCTYCGQLHRHPLTATIQKGPRQASGHKHSSMLQC